MKVVVLFSGGLDSTTALAMAIAQCGRENVTALSMRYGQKHQREIKSAQDIARYFDIEHIEMDLSEIFKFSSSVLLEGNGAVPQKSYEDQLNEMGGDGVVETYVPFRNGLFLATATAIALSLNASIIMYGAHRDDAAGGAYPDCTIAFNTAIQEAVYQGSGGLVRLVAPFIGNTKSEIVKMALRFKAPIELSWSCHNGDDTPCGKCGACLSRKVALATNGLADD